MGGPGSGRRLSIEPGSQAAAELIAESTVEQIAERISSTVRTTYRYLTGECDIPLRVAVRLEDDGGPPARAWIDEDRSQKNAT